MSIGSDVSPRRLASAVCIAAVPVVALAYLATSMRPAQPGLPYAPLIVGALCVGIALASSRAARIDALHPLVLLSGSFYVLYVLHPIVAAHYDVYVLPALGQPVLPGLSRALWLADLGLICTYAGYAWHLRHVSRVPERPVRHVSVRAQHAISGACLLMSLVALAATFRHSGGISILSGRTTEAVSALQSTGGYVQLMPTLLVGVAAYAIVANNGSRMRSASWILILLVGQTLFIGQGSRSFFVPAVLTVAIALVAATGSRGLAWKLAAPLAVIALLLLIILPRQLRESSQSRLGPLAGHGAVVGTIAGQDTAMADNLASAVQAIPNDIPYRNGATYIADLARPIPRGWWPGKPRSGDEYLNARLYPNFAAHQVGFAFGFWAEPYLNFGIAGVVILSILAGVALGSLRTLWRRRSCDPLAAASYAVSVPFIVVYMRGSLGTDYQRQVVATLPLILLYVFGRRAERRRTAHLPAALDRSLSSVDRARL